MNKSPTNNWFPVGFWFEISPGSVEIDKKKTANLKWMELKVNEISIYVIREYDMLDSWFCGSVFVYVYK